jgi:ubiquinone/menaquinone biosynthesis C-methylase UbiE
MPSSPGNDQRVIVEPEAGPSWDERAALDPLSAVIDPADTVGVNNRTVDELQRRGLRRALPPTEGLRVLDFGCGTGRMSGWLAGLGARPVGVDASPAMIDAARTNWPALEFKVLDETHLPFEDESFDLVLVVGVFQYLVQAGDALDRTLEEVRRVLTPQGHLFAIEQVHAGGFKRGAAADSYLRSIAASGMTFEQQTVIRRSDSRLFAQAIYRPWVARIPGFLSAVIAESRLRGIGRMPPGRYADVLFEARR